MIYLSCLGDLCDRSSLYTFQIVVSKIPMLVIWILLHRCSHLIFLFKRNVHTFILFLTCNRLYINLINIVNTKGINICVVYICKQVNQMSTSYQCLCSTRQTPLYLSLLIQKISALPVMLRTYPSIGRHVGNQFRNIKQYLMICYLRYIK